MKLDENAKKIVQKLCEAINHSIEQSPQVIKAIESLRAIGYEPNLSLRLDIGLQEITDSNKQTDSEEFELELTDEDLKTLHRMKIKL